MDIQRIVEAFPTKHPEGFTSSEIDLLLQQNFPAITRRQVSEKMGVVTALVKEATIIYYHYDVGLAIKCCLENREPNVFEFD